MQRITVVGLGPGSRQWLSLQTLDVLRGAERLVLRTRRHPAADELAHDGLRFLDCDDLYETHGTFEDVYGAIIERLMRLAEDGPVVYAVPGDPLMAERTVQLLRALPDVEVTILPALGVLNLVFARLALDPGDGLVIADARDPALRPSFEAPAPDDHAAFHGAATLDVSKPAVWLQVDTPLVASDLKILLLESYPPEHPVTLLTALGVDGEEQVVTLPLEAVDRGTTITHLTSLYVPPLPWPQRKHTITDLRAIMALLRSERGCPWDREQDMSTLRRAVIEESYEVADAVDRDDMPALSDELGDLLLNILFYAQLGAEDGLFDFDDVMRNLAEKLIRRHAHVFGDVEAATAGAVLKSWEGIKAGERARKGEHSIFDDVPQALPALLRAQKIQKRAARAGFDWQDFRGPLDKMHEELQELSVELGVPESWQRPPILQDPLAPFPEAKAMVERASAARTLHEVGDLLFAVVNLSRFIHQDAEETLREANERFIRRFQRVEAVIHARDQRIEDLPLAELDRIWGEIKGED